MRSEHLHRGRLDAVEACQGESGGDALDELRFSELGGLRCWLHGDRCMLEMVQLSPHSAWTVHGGGDGDLEVFQKRVVLSAGEDRKLSEAARQVIHA